MGSRRLKVLVSAYACSPKRGSEPGMGWRFVEALSEHHDLWVITEKEKFKEETEAELAKRPYLQERIRFFYIAKTRHRTLRKVWPASYYWFYKTWQKKAFKVAKELHEKIGFDIVHQLNMVGFREPGYLWKLDVPFVWGPIGGVGTLPWRFLPTLGLYGFFFHLGRNIINLLHMRFLIRPRLAAARAKVLIAATRDTQTAIKKLWNKNSEIICEVGPPAEIGTRFSKRKNGEPLKLVWSGLHIPRKAVNLLLHALALFNEDIDWQLDILGEGPRTELWKSLSSNLGIADRCNFGGWLDRDKAISIVGDSHVLVITSLKDLTSTVLLEALSQGVPVICLDHCGFSSVVTRNCGLKIRVESPKQAENDIAVAIKSLWNNEAYRQNLAKGALERARVFSWNNKVRTLNELYEEAKR